MTNENKKNTTTKNKTSNKKSTKKTFYKKKKESAPSKNKNNSSKAVQNQAKKTAKKPKTQNTQKKQQTKKPTVNKPVKKLPIRIIPLGGLNEIGKNMTCYEYEDDMFIVDCGISFPDSDMLGVDLVIPDFTYIEKNIDKLRAIVLTHGHEDHIGGLPYLLKKVNVSVYATRLTLALVEGKLAEHGILNSATLNVIKPKQTIKVGKNIEVEFVRVNHSIPDAVALAIKTPTGTIIQTGDFKVDYTPIEGEPIDLTRLAKLGDEGVLCLLSDSTNAERPGTTMSERKVGYAFEQLFKQAQGKRIIIATFASNVHRVKQILDNAKAWGRKVAVSGRSMVNVVNIARELGYLDVDDDIFIDIDSVSRYSHEKVVIITTGSQGEPMSALARMASNDHKKVTVGHDDFIIISATPIPGNEKHVTRVINELLMQGAQVIYESMYDVHVSGHACQDELKLMLSLTNPKFFMPVHGEYKHLKRHAEIGYSIGIPEQNVHIGNIGQVIEIDDKSMKVTGLVPAGRVFVDGLGVGDVGSVVLRDRKHLSQDGIIIVVASIDSYTGEIVAGPDIVTRGFVYVKESEELMDLAKQVVLSSFDKCLSHGVREWAQMKNIVRDDLSGFIYKKTKRSPMILPILMNVQL